MAPADSSRPHRPPSFPALADTALHLNSVPDRRGTAPSTTLNSPSHSQNTAPSWLFPSQHSPSPLPSPSSNHHSPLSARSNHPSPATDTAQSPSTMIGATPTYYDPEQDTQPQAQDYQHWIDNTYRQTSLVYSNTPSYPPQPSVSDSLTPQPSVSHSRPQRQMQSQAPRHTNHYQFVTSHPPPPASSSDATQYGFFENPSNHPFDSRLGPTQRQSRVPTSWPQQPSAEFTQPPPPSDDPTYYLMTTTDQYPGMTDTVQQPQRQYSSPSEHLTPGVALTPASDATLQSGQSISPAWTDNQPLPPHGTGLSNTPSGSVTFQASPKPTGKRTQNKTTKQRKRQKSDTDTDDDDDVEANVGANMPRPNRL
ncbi:hypothetical protein EDB92DRAFT_1949961 [Lactarius akahatsu]|uniref:Uncharacterized protein n=1 Tax=Lactarius akahatsu TaxID=416441 RepID=A0AAD4LA99_9AGAM|nr:hypothetical protein EDB92DRAFT_1949961 [Lactarius akahatsu]